MPTRRPRRLRLEELELRCVPAASWLGAGWWLSPPEHSQAQEHASERSRVNNPAKGKAGDSISLTSDAIGGATKGKHGKTASPKKSLSAGELAGSGPIAILPVVTSFASLRSAPVTAPGQTRNVALGRAVDAAFAEDEASAVEAFAAPAVRTGPTQAVAPTLAVTAVQATGIVTDLQALAVPTPGPLAAETVRTGSAGFPSQQPAHPVAPARGQVAAVYGGAEAAADELFAQPELVLPESPAPAREELLTPGEIAAGLVVGAGSLARVLSRHGSDLSGVGTVLGEGAQTEGQLSPLAGLLISPLDRMLEWASDGNGSTHEGEAEDEPGWSWQAVLLGAGAAVGAACAAGLGRRAGSRGRPGLRHGATAPRVPAAG